MNDVPTTRASLLVRLSDPQDERAWGEFLEVYEPLVYRLARHNGFQDADAREVTQEIFLAVRSAIERWDPEPSRGRFRSWLFRIARNLMINWLIARRRRPQAAGGEDFQRFLEQQPDPTGQDSALFDQQYRREAFRWAAERIRPEFREATWQAFWLTTVEGVAIKDVAGQLGMTVGAVYKCRSRVMARLKEVVERLEGAQ
jgi:RNA polymerase sigma-70 factor (ECF subfamily)